MLHFVVIAQTPSGTTFHHTCEALNKEDAGAKVCEWYEEDCVEVLEVQHTH